MRRRRAPHRRGASRVQRLLDPLRRQFAMELVNPFRGQLDCEEKLWLEAHGTAPSTVPCILILLFSDGKPSLPPPRQVTREGRPTLESSLTYRQETREGRPTLESSLTYRQVTREGQPTLESSLTQAKVGAAAGAAN